MRASRAKPTPTPIAMLNWLDAEEDISESGAPGGGGSGAPESVDEERWLLSWYIDLLILLTSSTVTTTSALLLSKIVAVELILLIHTEFRTTRTIHVSRAVWGDAEADGKTCPSTHTSVGWWGAECKALPYAVVEWDHYFINRVIGIQGVKIINCNKQL